MAGTQSYTVLTKSEFARVCNVTPARVTAWIKNGRIDGAAIVGTGRHAQIVVEIARGQLRARLDPLGRRFSGSKTALGDSTAGDVRGALLGAEVGNLIEKILAKVPNERAAASEGLACRRCRAALAAKVVLACLGWPGTSPPA